MITIITSVIIAQMDKFLKNSFNLLKGTSKIKINTAIKNRRHCQCSFKLRVSPKFLAFSKNF